MTDVINLIFMHKFEDRQINKLNNPPENRVMLDEVLPRLLCLFSRNKPRYGSPGYSVPAG